MIKCIIFDSDGTLVDSEPLGHKCMSIQLAKYGYEVSQETMEELYRGWKLHDILDEIAKSFDNFSLPENFIPEYRVELNLMFESELQAMPGVEEALQKIKLPICLASSGPMLKIEMALKVTGLKKYFGDNIFSAYIIKAWKPDPKLFLVAAETMGFKPDECLVIEDSEVGVQAALAAGMKVIHYNPSGIKISVEEDVVVIHHMNQLVAKVQEL